MLGLEPRIERLEAAEYQNRRPGISHERRKALTDRAVLHGDLVAPQALSVCRSPNNVVNASSVPQPSPPV
jgi:hypothetical protein